MMQRRLEKGGISRMYRLIIVDDEPKIAEGMGSLFPWQNVGFEVAGTFTSACQALTFMEQERIDVVMSDVQMPDMDGIQLCQKLENEQVKVVLFSSHQNYEYFRSAIRYKAVDYLLKPVSFAALMECFESIRTQLDQETQQSEELPRSFWQETIQEVLTYINEHSRDASLERAAERVHLSPSYLSRNFKEKSGESFSHALIRIRMEKAKEMLMDARNRSYDVAYFVGYDNPKNFSRAFKSYYGMTPSEYRKSVLGGDVDE